MLAPVLAALIVLGYAASLWWLLRHESATTLAWLVALSGLSLSLRLMYTKEFPPGLTGDEPQYLIRAVSNLKNGDLFGELGGPPALLISLFQVPLIPIFGPGWWAIRTYPLICSVLAVPAAFAMARAMGLRVAPSLAAGAFVAVLPWSIFYGRISLGGEMVFHQLLLLAALARLVWASGSWPEVAIGSLGLCLLLYDYAAARTMAGMPLLAAVLAKGWRRAWCLAILLVAFLGWAPHLHADPQALAIGFSRGGYHPGFHEQPLATLQLRTLRAFETLTAPIGTDSVYTIRSAGMHPPLVLALAVLGSLTGVRRSLFFWGGLLGGLFPAVFSCCDKALSAHRMLMAFPFISLAAACALNLPRPPLLRRLASVIAIVVVGTQSVRLYFSPAFWPPESVGQFDPSKTALMEALPSPPHPRLIAMQGFEPYFGLRELVHSTMEPLTVENWFPLDGASIYAFTEAAAPLLPFYQNLFGQDRVHVFGQEFMVTLEARDWSWVRQHGWMYEAHCGGETWRSEVPALFHPYLTFAGLRRTGTVTQSWQGRWDGPPAELRLRFSGDARVETAGGPIAEKQELDSSLDFTVATGTPLKVIITATPGAGLNAALLEVTPAGERVPVWDRVSPISDAG